MADAHTVPNALSALVLQVMRMRRLRPLPQSREAVIAHLRQELQEVEDEDEGSQADIRERGDVLALAINLALAIEEEGAGGLVDAAERVTEKLRLRLNLVELRGLPWSQAKVLVP